jgi:outer membrane protein assembly factor BamD (BamD/ComL family)
VPSAESSTLAQEVAVLDNARRALADGRATEALGALDRYERSFPRGHMGQEVAFVRMQALIQSGDRAGATLLAERFLQTHPDSPLAPRVRELLRSGSEPSDARDSSRSRLR